MQHDTSNGMNILVIGGGGREHALAWKAAASGRVERVYVAPGNAGTAGEAKVENVAIDPGDCQALAKFAGDHRVALTIVGPEAPLVAGIVDHFQAAGLPCLGPSKAAARLEGSKAFAKDFLQRHRIPTAHHQTFTQAPPALEYLRGASLPIVIKADGLAAGKGVIVATTRAEAEAAVHDMLAGDSFGEAGRRVVIEDYLEGEEASFIALVDGKHVLPLASSQDHKPRDNGDKGPNTGGMGAYSPAPVVSRPVHDRIMEEIMLPTVAGMKADGNPYRGFLYAGLMISPDGVPRVMEFNCRFGDPEAQPILMRLATDLVPLCEATLAGTLDRTAIDFDPRAALGVVMAAGGYPGSYRKGDAIEGLTNLPATGDCQIFHAGTAARDDGTVVTSGGRVLCATALGANVTAARNRAYELVDRIHWQDVYYRTDIGHRAIAREQAASKALHDEDAAH